MPNNQLQNISDIESKLNYALSKRELKRMIDNGTRKFSSAAKIVDLLQVQGTHILPDEVRSAFKSAGVSYSSQSIAHLNMRGGIGKTTASISLATRAVQYGFKTCLLDLDPQASATYALFPDMTDEHLVVADIWENTDELLDESLVEVSKDLYLLPSSLDNSILDDEWDDPAIQKTAVKKIIDKLKSDGFDLIVIDAPPSLNCIVISVIAAVDTIIVPVWSDPFSVRGLEILIQESAQIAAAFERNDPIIQILFAQYDSRLKLSESVFQSLKKKYPKQLLKSRIRTSTEFSKAIHKQETVFRKNLKHVASIDYDAYVREVLSLSIPSPY
ncbi:MAG: ParA family protein [Balneolales bacterium]|nr:ParA family protein [Balneolales bacterium]